MFFYERNFTGEDEIEVQMESALSSQVDNAMTKQTSKEKIISVVSKDKIKQSANDPGHVDQTLSQIVPDVYTRAAETENQQAASDEREPISLWKEDESDNFLEDGDTVEHEEPITINPEVLANLQVGQVLDFFVPQLGESFQSEVTSTSNQFGDVKVWKGDIQGEEQGKSNFIMTQGEKMTKVVLSTTEGIYTVNINNKTSRGTVVDNREYTSRMSDIDDAVPYYYNEPQSE
jgi:hypothetical protein